MYKNAMSYNSLLLPLILISLLPSSVKNFKLATAAEYFDHTFCIKTSECIEKVKKMVQETDRFWFGNLWKLKCLNSGEFRSKNNNKITFLLECMNPPELMDYDTLGSRLFRFKTYTDAYFKNLRIFPRIRFTPRSGRYRACGHNFSVEVESNSFLEAHPESSPFSVFKTLQMPEIKWAELRQNDSFIVLMLDAGFGELKFLATNFPQNTKIIREYDPIENVRLKQPTPLVILVFEPSNTNIEITIPPLDLDNDNTYMPFDLSTFMLDNGIERGLIGMNWAMISADAFAIERQRLKGFVDNCHSLLQAKLLQDQRWNFVDAHSINELNSHISISVRRPTNRGRICCTSFNFGEEELFADPFADRQLPSSALRKEPPKFTSLQPFENINVFNVFRRSNQRHMALKEDRYTFVIMNPDDNFLHWLVVDIPADDLSTGLLINAFQAAEYLPPIPYEPNECLFAVFILLKQPIRSRLSQHTSNYPRHFFNIALFKSRHQLKFSALSWAKICFDFYEAIFRVKMLTSVRSWPKSSSNLNFIKNNWLERIKNLNSMAKSKVATDICEKIGIRLPQKCVNNALSFRWPSSSLFIIPFNFLLINFCLAGKL